MLWRLVAKILLKACVPLLAIAGVLSYGVYLRGGDPAALWQSVAARSLDQFDKLFAGVRDDASRAAGAIGRSAAGVATASEAEGRTTVFTWKDADGVTHYSTVRPQGVAAGTVSVDPNVNVLAPVRPAVPEPAIESASSTSREAVTEDSAATLPGVAGQVLATREPAQSSRDNADQPSGLDPAQLLRMLQAAEK
ncbi:DUF4124 domain-containing protein [Granulosicoccus sp. 3-233]|uniref:DUF4124 domain-containing protein n=1 Tax=Granulosicoccus sp. 3-233 TaxID=3417969 RepID=UPI003D349AE3